MILVSRAKAALAADHSGDTPLAEREFLHLETQHFVVTAEHAWAEEEGCGGGAGPLRLRARVGPCGLCSSAASLTRQTRAPTARERAPAPVLRGPAAPQVPRHGPRERREGPRVLPRGAAGGLRGLPRGCRADARGARGGAERARRGVAGARAPLPRVARQPRRVVQLRRRRRRRRHDRLLRVRARRGAPPEAESPRGPRSPGGPPPPQPSRRTAPGRRPPRSAPTRRSADYAREHLPQLHGVEGLPSQPRSRPRGRRPRLHLHRGPPGADASRQPARAAPGGGRRA